MVFLILGIIFGSIFITFIIFFIIMGKIVFESSFRRREGDEHFAETEPRKAKNAPDRKWFFSQVLEERNLKSFDGLNLKGFFVKNNSNKLVIFVHGYHGRYYSLTKQAQFFYENGYNMLLINNRCHDLSEGKYFSMGKFEVRDLKDWIKLMLKENPNYEICLFGVSMGAHIVMMTVNDVPSNVKCAVEDCGYASLYEEMQFSIKKSTKTYRLAAFAGNIYSKLFYRFSFNSNTKNILKDSKVPMLFMHGDKDSMVPFENLKKNYDNFTAPYEKRMHVFTDCNHCEQIKIKGEEYKEIVNDFVNKYIA